MFLQKCLVDDMTFSSENKTDFFNDFYAMIRLSVDNEGSFENQCALTLVLVRLYVLSLNKKKLSVICKTFLSRTSF